MSDKARAADRDHWEELLRILIRRYPDTDLALAIGEIDRLRAVIEELRIAK